MVMTGSLFSAPTMYANKANKSTFVFFKFNKSPSAGISKNAGLIISWDTNVYINGMVAPIMIYSTSNNVGYFYKPNITLLQMHLYSYMLRNLMILHH